MNVTPESTTWRSNAIPPSWSGYSPHTWSPVSCMAPRPIRPTVRSPPIVTVSAMCVTVVISTFLASHARSFRSVAAGRFARRPPLGVSGAEVVSDELDGFGLGALRAMRVASGVEHHEVVDRPAVAGRLDVDARGAQPVGATQVSRKAWTSSANTSGYWFRKPWPASG